MHKNKQFSDGIFKRFIYDFLAHIDKKGQSLDKNVKMVSNQPNICCMIARES